MPNRPELQTNYDRFDNRISNKGVMRTVRTNKRFQAENRNANSPELKKRAHWKALGFRRESDASRIVRETVLEANAMADAVRARSGQDDWAEDHDPVMVALLTEILSPESQG